MTGLKELLQYQEVDKELRKIEQELASSEERKKYMQAKKFIESAREKLDAQEARAAELRKAKETLAARCEDMAKAISEYGELDAMLEESGGDVSFYKKKAQELSERLRGLKAELNRLVSDVEGAIGEYKKLREQTIAMQKQGAEYTEKFKQVRNARAAETDAVNARLAEIGKSIPPEILEKYKTKRRERIFPIVVPVGGDMCICGMEFSLAQRGRLASGELVECEHCRRMLYKA